MALPAEFANRRSHHALGLTRAVALGVVVEVDARVVRGRQALGRLLGGFELVSVGEGHPTAKGQDAHFES